MKVSVIIPAWNAQQHIGQALDSVLTQTLKPFEVIVVDDASKDEGAAIARTLGATVISLPQNVGPAAARNRGIEAARGELIAFLDADDLWVPEKLEWQVQALQKHPGLSGVMGQLEVFGNGWANPNRRAEASESLLGTTLFRRNVFSQVGLLDESLRFGEDVDWLLRLRELGLPFAKCPRTVLRYRLHDNSSTAQQPDAVQLAVFQVIHKRKQRFNGRPPRLPEIPMLENS